MPDRTCFRCHHALPAEPPALPEYCAHCGSPQLILSPELSEQLTDRLAGDATAEQTAPPLPSRTGALVIQSCALAAVGELAFHTLSLLAPGFHFLETLWALTAPTVVVSLYASRSRRAVINGRVGAAIGMLTAVFVSLTSVTISAASSLFARYALHNTAVSDEQVNSLVAQCTAQLNRQQAAAPAARDITPLINAFTLPENRAWLLLGVGATAFAAYAFSATALGALAGYVRGASRARTGN